MPRGKSIVYFICRHKFKIMLRYTRCKYYAALLDSLSLSLLLILLLTISLLSLLLLLLLLVIIMFIMALLLILLGAALICASFALTSTRVCDLCTASIDLYGSLISCVCVYKVTGIIPDHLVPSRAQTGYLIRACQLQLQCLLCTCFFVNSMGHL